MNSLDKIYYSFRSYVQEFSLDKLRDPKIAAVALGSLGLVALAFSTYRSSKKDPQMIQDFEAKWQRTTPSIPFIKMNGYIGEEDAKLLSGILQSWQIDSGFSFFDLLGADLYRDLKSQGANTEVLSSFCASCKFLSILMQVHLKFSDVKASHSKTEADAAIHANIEIIRNKLKSLQNQIPLPLKPKFNFFVKMLSDPNKTFQLGLSAIENFGYNELQVQSGENLKDFQDMLEFAAAQYPSTFKNFSKIKSHARLSKEFSYLANKIRNSALEKNDKMELCEVSDQLCLIRRLKDTVDTRFLKIDLPYLRTFENITALSPHGSIDLPLKIQKEYERFLGRLFFKHLEMNPSIASFSRYERIPFGEVQDYIFHLINACDEKSIVSLEIEIVKMLKEERRVCFEKSSSDQKDLDAYAEFFAHCVRLYQMAHDIQFIKDPTKNFLQERSFPKSFADLACLTFSPEPGDSLEPLPNPSSRKAEKALMGIEIKDEAEAPTPFEKSRGSFAGSSVGAAGKATEFIEDEEVDGENQLEPSSSDRDLQYKYAHFDDSDSKKPSQEAPSIPPRHIEQIDFPTRNVKPGQVINILLNNGFVISHVSGSHYQLKHVKTNVRTTVPYHSSDVLKKGTLSSIRAAFYESQK